MRLRLGKSRPLTRLAQEREQYFALGVAAPQCRQWFINQANAYCGILSPTRMKSVSLSLVLASSLLFAQCAKTPEVAPKINYDQKSTEIVQGVSPAVVGDWTLRRVQIKAQPYNGGQLALGIVRDTVLQDFATISIRPAPSRSSIPDLRYARFSGVLHYRTKTYPIQFELSASPQRLFHDEGPQAVFLLEYNFPVGSHPTEVEEQFLQSLGLIGEHFTLQVVPGQPRTMTWQGSYRGIGTIELVK
jgi:hypothetical protein